MKIRFDRLLSIALCAAILLSMFSLPFTAVGSQYTYSSVFNRETKLLATGDTLTELSGLLPDNDHAVVLEFYIDSTSTCLSSVTKKLNDASLDYNIPSLTDLGAVCDQNLLDCFNGWQVDNTYLSVDGLNYTVELVAMLLIPSGLSAGPDNQSVTGFSAASFEVGFNTSDPHYGAFGPKINGGIGAVQATWYTDDKQPELNLTADVPDGWAEVSGTWQSAPLASSGSAVLSSDEFTLTAPARLSFDNRVVGNSGDTLTVRVIPSTGSQSENTFEANTAGSCVIPLEAGTYTLEFTFYNSAGPETDDCAFVSEINFATVLEQNTMESGGNRFDIDPSVDPTYFYNGFSIYCVVVFPMNNSGTPATYTITQKTQTATLTINENTYTATFNATGGTVDGLATEDITFVPSTGLPNMPTPVRDYYNFLGWSDTDPSDPEVTEFPGAFSIPPGYNMDITLYAWWQATEYTLTYHVNGGGEIEPYTFTVETDNYALPVPIKDGNTFLGWYSDSGFGGSPVAAINLGTTGSFEVFAKWEEITYNVDYQENAGSAVADTTYTVSTGIATLPVTVRNGYDFLGWFDNAELLGSAVTSIPIGSTGNKVLYANWQIITHTLTYVVNGGNPIEAVGFSQLDGVASLPNATKLGCNFLGWYDNPGFSGNAVTSVPPDTTHDVTLYAKWQEITYNVDYQENSGSAVADATYTVSTGIDSLPVTVRNGFDFLGWYDNIALEGTAVTSIPIGSTGNKILYAKWKVIEHTLTYVVNGGNTIDAVEFYQFSGVATLPGATRLGCNFLGWYDNPDFTGNAVTSIPPNTTHDVTLYAKWQVNVFSITYNSNGGTEIQPASFTSESGYPTLPVPTKENYAFVGWYDNESFSGSPVTGIPADTRAENAVFYAKWQRVYYQIYYNTNGGSAISPDTVAVSVVFNDIKTPVRVGYDFLGWFDNEALQGAAVTSIAAEHYSDVNLYAKWSPSVYTVSYVENGGNVVPNDSFTAINGLASLRVTARTGYTFGGWYQSPSFTGSPMTSIPAYTLSNVVLYAKWNAVSYNVVYHTNGGTEIANGTYTIVTGVANLPEPVYEGFTFVGWYDNAELSGEAVTEYLPGTVGDKDLYAKWEEDKPDELSFFARLIAAFVNIFASIAKFFGNLFA